MATATITQTPDPRQNTNYSLLAQMARDLKIEFGTILFDGGTYLDGGIAFAPKIGTAKLVALILLPKGADAGGRIFTYDYTNFKIQVYEAGTASASLDELDTGADTLNETLEYIAIGY